MPLPNCMPSFQFIQVFNFRARIMASILEKVTDLVVRIRVMCNDSGNCPTPSPPLPNLDRNVSFMGSSGN